MRCINSPSTDIYFNLAAEEYLLKHTTEDVFMLWQNTPSVVVGKHQRVLAEVDVDFVKQKQINIARRFSGGGTVYHDCGNMNLTFIETAKLAKFDTYLKRTVDFLASVGLSVRADERMGIYIGSLKISGSAQCVHKNRVMYHCTLLYDTDLNQLNGVLNAPPVFADTAPVYSVPSVRSEVTNISWHLRQSYSPDEFRELVFRYFATGASPYTFSEKERLAIECLRTDKYIREEWIALAGTLPVKKSLS